MRLNVIHYEAFVSVLRRFVYLTFLKFIKLTVEVSGTGNRLIVNPNVAR